MNPIAPALESHLQGTVTTHCFVWIIRREDNVIFGFTDHDQTLIVQNIACEPQSGLSGSEASTLLGLGTSGSEIEGALVSLRIHEEDIEAGYYDGASVDAFLVNWAKPVDHMLLHRWTIGKITRSGSRFIAEIKGATAAYDKIHGRRILRQCNAELGDARCGVIAGNPAFSASATVSAVTLPDIRATAVEAYANDWFTHGRLEWKAGVNAGSTARIIAHQQDVLRLRDTPIFPVSVGDVFEVTVGCDKSFAQCKAKFDNASNFRGFPHLPGNDAAYSYVSQDMDFDGGVLVP